MPSRFLRRRVLQQVCKCNTPRSFFHDGKRWADIVKFVQSISPSLTINSDPVNAVEVNLNFKPLKESAEEILNLPERLPRQKASMSSCVLMSSNNWQTCPTGSAWKEPCVRCGKDNTVRPTVSMAVNATWWWIYSATRRIHSIVWTDDDLEEDSQGILETFIHDSFYNHGKSISDDMIERICNAMQCHSWYMQQFCFLIWTRTATEVTEEIYQSQLANFGYQCRYVHYRYWWYACLSDSIPACRLHGRDSFQCPTGSSRIWTRCSTDHHQEQKTLVERDFIEKSGDGFKMVDPVFELWFKREYCNILPQ